MKIHVQIQIFLFLKYPFKKFRSSTYGRAKPRKPGITAAEMLFSRRLKTTQIYRHSGEKAVYKLLQQKEKKIYYLCGEKAFHDPL